MPVANDISTFLSELYMEMYNANFIHLFLYHILFLVKHCNIPSCGFARKTGACILDTGVSYRRDLQKRQLRRVHLNTNNSFHGGKLSSILHITVISFFNLACCLKVWLAYLRSWCPENSSQYFLLCKYTIQT